MEFYMNKQVKNNKNYLSTQVKVIIVISVLIAIFIPVWLLLKPTETPQSGNNASNPDYSLYDEAVWADSKKPVGTIEMADVESIHVQRVGDEEWGFVYNYTEESYFLDGYGKKIAYDTTVCQYMVYYVSSAPALKLISENTKDMSKYGLADDSESLIRIRVKTRDGKSVELLMGDEVADGEGFYATTAGNDNVYTVNTIVHGYFDCSALDVMNLRITNPFTESLYVPHYFVIYHGTEKFVELKYFDNEAAADQEYVKTTQVTYPIADIPQGASGAYSDMLYNYVRGSINGERVVAAEKENESFTAEFLKENFGIDKDDPACKRLVFHRNFEEDDLGLIENDVLFSPKDNEGYYYAYNLALGTVVKIHSDSVPFMDWEAEQFMEPTIYLQNINAIKEIHIDSSGMRDIYVKDGNKKLNETFLSNAPGGTEAALLKVTRGDGSALKNVVDSDGKQVRSGIDNYRYMYLALQSVDLLQKMSDEDIAKKGIDVNNPDLVITIRTAAGNEHILRFCYYGSSGAYFTYNGKGGYSVSQSALRDLLLACYNVCNGQLAYMD